MDSDIDDFEYEDDDDDDDNDSIKEHDPTNNHKEAHVSTSPPRTQPQPPPPPSEEQMVAIQHVLDGHNVVLDAVAGSGKSTTILSLASLAPAKKILQIAYNAMLRKDIEVKLRRYGIRNVKVHTFHSLCVRYYCTSAHTDTGIRHVLLQPLPPREPIPPFDIVVLDEAQDMSFLYYQLMVKFAFDMGTRFQILVLGDYMQGIYDFKGADIRALTHAEEIWKHHPLLLSPTFHQCTLYTSYRITHPMAHFVNRVMLGNERLQATKDGPRVLYLRNKRRNLEHVVIFQINQLLREGASPGDIFVLGASVKGINSNIRKMENALVERGIPCYVPMFETEQMDDKVIEGKVVFSTFHSSKGRERPYVFVMGFDQSYFYFASNLPQDRCPNTLYVACTRATKLLVVLEKDDFSTDRPLDFLQKTHHQMQAEPYVDFKGMPRSIFYLPAESNGGNSGAAKEPYFDVSPTELVKYISEHVLEQISPLLAHIFIQEVAPTPASELQIPNVVCTSQGLFEDVCDLNGIAIPSIYYDHIFRLYFDKHPQSDTASASTSSEDRVRINVGASVLKQVIDECMRDTKDHECLHLKQLIAAFPDECDTVSDYLRLANLFVAAKERLLFKIKQIDRDDYTWLSDDAVEQCLRRLDDVIGPECETHLPLVEHTIVDKEMEEEIERTNLVLRPFFSEQTRKFRFTARADLVTDRCIWELKCTSSLSIEHKLQVVLYDWLWRIKYTPDVAVKRRAVCTNPKEARLINIKTGEILRLNATFDDLTTIVVELLKGKYEAVPHRTTEEFLGDCHQFLQSQSTLFAAKVK
jgi:hypothetical protein